MAKASTSRKKKKKSSTAKRGSRRHSSEPSVSGRHLVIVESPAKARTINRYLGDDFVVRASIGHVRDLPPRAPKGCKQPVPGVDIEDHFRPTYEVLPAKKKVVAELKKAAKEAADVWFATDLDREGEAIAWHLTQVLGIDPQFANRVVFNAITRAEIERAFSHPHRIDEFKVNAQQARRILDRIVGYQVSPLLWKKVARGLSAGRVQSVALRMVVEREHEIRSFVPEEYWRVSVMLSIDPAAAAPLGEVWGKFMAKRDEKNNPPTLKAQNVWLGEHRSIKAELVELDGEKFELGCPADKPEDLSRRVERVAEAAGLLDVEVIATDNPDGKGPAQTLRRVNGRVDPAARYRVKSIDTKRSKAKPPAPFITVTLQAAASTALGFGTERTMRVAQELYEGVDVPGVGQVGLITYMRTDSTHLSNEALAQVRDYIGQSFGSEYLPKSANVYAANKAAQEAHEGIRPADTTLDPQKIASGLSVDQRKLYELIWKRFVACQMTPAQWDATTALLERSDKPTGAVVRATGRVLVFDGYYRVAGVPTSADEQNLPELGEQDVLGPFSIDPRQRFTSAPPRYTEASLVKALDAEGIGRPSTYAQIIGVIQQRQYVEQMDRRFYATDLGEIVTAKLVEAFPRLMDVSYTRQMEAELDQIEENHTDWISMLEKFYGSFSRSLEEAHATMVHAKAETQPAVYQCAKCGSSTCYRFGKNGRFLSCTAYPNCDFAAAVDREGHPLLPQRINVACPADGSPMVLRTGRFGPFLASVNYPEVNCVINVDRNGGIKYPTPPPLQTDLPCPKCGAALNLRRGKRGPWLGCSTFPKCRGRFGWTKLEKAKREALLAELEAHEGRGPRVEIRTLDGKLIAPGTPVGDLTMPGGVAELAIHPDAELPRSKSA